MGYSISSDTSNVTFYADTIEEAEKEVKNWINGDYEVYSDQFDTDFDDDDLDDDDDENDTYTAEYKVYDEDYETDVIVVNVKFDKDGYQDYWDYSGVDEVKKMEVYDEFFDKISEAENVTEMLKSLSDDELNLLIKNNDLKLKLEERWFADNKGYWDTVGYFNTSAKEMKEMLNNSDKPYDMTWIERYVKHNYHAYGKDVHFLAHSDNFRLSAIFGHDPLVELVPNKFAWENIEFWEGYGKENWEKLGTDYQEKLIKDYSERGIDIIDAMSSYKNIQNER